MPTIITLDISAISFNVRARFAKELYYFAHLQSSLKNITQLFSFRKNKRLLVVADIVGTAVAPSWDQIANLAAIAPIETFLNYFLNR